MAAVSEPAMEVRRLGERIRERRKELGLSLRDVAAMTDLSATFINAVEHGNGNPTLASIRKIAYALKVPLFRLLDAPPDSRPVVRRNQRARISFPPGNVTYELLTPQLNRKMVAFQVRATADAGNMMQQPLAQPTEELIIVLQGRFAITIAGVTYELEAGDSIYFENRYWEGIRVISEGEAEYLSIQGNPLL